MNLFNAALVTPTYYVLFTSSTIVTSAVLFQGFKGTPLQIVTVIMGFLQICSGVVLLQLSKSAKDVPDTAVFKGDLDQIRTVAEVEEPEYEPRADTLRGGAAILRTLSRARSKKELNEALKIKEEHMQPIGEGDQVEFDGLRRRKTVVGDFNRPPARQPTIVNSKTIHPPLGMSQFPSYDSDDDDNDNFHPGFFQRLRSRGKSTGSRSSANAPGATSSAVGMRSLPPIPTETAFGQTAFREAEDTAYRPHDQHVQFAPPIDPDTLPRPPSAANAPSNGTKRQFSFHNVFGRNRADSTGEGSNSKRPTSRHSRKASGDIVAAATEEERLGLVKGDSNTLLPIPSRVSEEQAPPVYADNWDMQRTDGPGGPSVRTIPAPAERIRRVETADEERDAGKDYEKGGTSSGAFL